MISSYYTNIVSTTLKMRKKHVNLLAILNMTEIKFNYKN